MSICVGLQWREAGSIAELNYSSLERGFHKPRISSNWRRWTLTSDGTGTPPSAASLPSHPFTAEARWQRTPVRQAAHRARRLPPPKNPTNGTKVKTYQSIKVGEVQIIKVSRGLAMESAARCSARGDGAARAFNARVALLALALLWPSGNPGGDGGRAGGGGGEEGQGGAGGKGWVWDRVGGWGWRGGGAEGGDGGGGGGGWGGGGMVIAMAGRVGMGRLDDRVVGTRLPYIPRLVPTSYKTLLNPRVFFIVEGEPYETWRAVSARPYRGVSEASGLVASKRNPGILWTHNDSGDRARGAPLTTPTHLPATLTENRATLRQLTAPLFWGFESNPQ